ncbi:MAG TPA: hypothetical protein VKX41_21545 [Alloacidobacterium sp.]|jgi:hypothetical protein|nr:hypothetical protein [Alloacidobacterium sp.]
MTGNFRDRALNKAHYKSERASSLAEARPFFPNFLKVWFGFQTTTAFTSESHVTFVSCDSRFRDLLSVPAIAKASSVSIQGFQFPVRLANAVTGAPDGALVRFFFWKISLPLKGSILANRKITRPSGKFFRVEIKQVLWKCDPANGSTDYTLSR